MNEQTLLNILFGIISFLFGWILKALWEGYAALKNADSELIRKVNAIELLVAGEYAKKSEMSRLFDKVFEKLDNLKDDIVSIKTHDKRE